MIDKKQFKEMINEVTDYLGIQSKAGTNLLLGTAAQESGFGTYFKQIGGGPALGIFQMEPKTHMDLHLNYIHGREDRFSFLYDDWVTFPAVRLEWNLKYAIIMARIHYLRVPEALPKADWIYDNTDNKKPHPLWIEDMANYYKQYWNTYLGKSTVDKAVKADNKYCL